MFYRITLQPLQSVAAEAIEWTDSIKYESLTRTLKHLTINFLTIFMTCHLHFLDLGRFKNIFLTKSRNFVSLQTS